jgi:hypothetical protein
LCHQLLRAAQILQVWENDHQGVGALETSDDEPARHHLQGRRHVCEQAGLESITQVQAALIEAQHHLARNLAKGPIRLACGVMYPCEHISWRLFSM